MIRFLGIVLFIILASLAYAQNNASELTIGSPTVANRTPPRILVKQQDNLEVELEVSGVNKQDLPSEATLYQRAGETLAPFKRFTLVPTGETKTFYTQKYRLQFQVPQTSHDSEFLLKFAAAPASTNTKTEPPPSLALKVVPVDFLKNIQDFSESQPIAVLSANKTLLNFLKNHGIRYTHLDCHDLFSITQPRIAIELLEKTQESCGLLLSSPVALISLRESLDQFPMLVMKMQQQAGLLDVKLPELRTLDTDLETQTILAKIFDFALEHLRFLSKGVKNENQQ